MAGRSSVLQLILDGREDGVSITETIKKNVHQMETSAVETRDWLEGLKEDLQTEPRSTNGFEEKASGSADTKGLLLSAIGLSAQYITHPKEFLPFLACFMDELVRVLNSTDNGNQKSAQLLCTHKMLAVVSATRVVGTFGNEKQIMDDYIPKLVNWVQNWLHRPDSVDLTDETRLLATPVNDFINVLIQARVEWSTEICQTLLSPLIQLHTMLITSTESPKLVCELSNTIGLLLESMLGSPSSALQLLRVKSFVSLDEEDGVEHHPPHNQHSPLRTLPIDENAPTRWNLPLNVLSMYVEAVANCNSVMDHTCARTLEVQASLAAISATLAHLCYKIYEPSVSQDLVHRVISWLITATQAFQEVTKVQQIETLKSMVEALEELLGRVPRAFSGDELWCTYKLCMEQVVPNLQTAMKEIKAQDRALFTVAKSACSEIRQKLFECVLRVLHVCGDSFLPHSTAFLRLQGKVLADPRILADLCFSLQQQQTAVWLPTPTESHGQPEAHNSTTCEDVMRECFLLMSKATRRFEKYNTSTKNNLLDGVSRLVVATKTRCVSYLPEYVSFACFVLQNDERHSEVQFHALQSLFTILNIFLQTDSEIATTNTNTSDSTSDTTTSSVCKEIVSSLLFILFEDETDVMLQCGIMEGFVSVHRETPGFLEFLHSIPEAYFNELKEHCTEALLSPSAEHLFDEYKAKRRFQLEFLSEMVSFLLHQNSSNTNSIIRAEERDVQSDVDKYQTILNSLTVVARDQEDSELAELCAQLRK